MVARCEISRREQLLTEKWEIEQKAKKLSDFIGLDPAFEAIAQKEQELMREQCEIMWQYFEILQKRIDAIPAG